jgi:hypothetical protein
MTRWPDWTGHAGSGLWRPPQRLRCAPLVSTYRPPSKVGKPDPDLDTLHVEVMPWMVGPLLNWLEPFLWIKPQHKSRISNDFFIDSLEMALRLRQPLIRRHPASAARDVTDRITAGGTFGIDVVSHAVHEARAPEAHDLNAILHASGSAWEVTPTLVEGGKRKRVYLVTRRDLAAAKDAITATASFSQRAARHLTSSWQQVATRDPDPNGAYDQAVKAVEAVAQPIVSPKNSNATLGTILRDMKAKPSKWTFELQDVDTVIAMSETLWTKHIRHGTDVRTDHTVAEADAALHLAIPLVRFFAGGLVVEST